MMGGVGVCDRGSWLICRCWVWSVGISVISRSWDDWRGCVAVCLWVVVRVISLRRWATVVRNLLYLLAEAGGN